MVDNNKNTQTQLHSYTYDIVCFKTDLFVACPENNRYCSSDFSLTNVINSYSIVSVLNPFRF